MAACQESIYSDEIARAYYRNELTLAVEPHVFGVSANAYRNLITTRKPQCIVISGDSGAGKTETAKQARRPQHTFPAHLSKQRNIALAPADWFPYRDCLWLRSLAALCPPLRSVAR